MGIASLSRRVRTLNLSVHAFRLVGAAALLTGVVLLGAPLAAAAAAPAAAAVSTGSSPREMPHYRLLEQALERYRALAVQEDLTGLPPLPRRSLKEGDSWEGMPALRRLLLALRDLQDATPPDPQSALVLDAVLVEALQRFQERHGLDTDGVLGPATWRALTTPLGSRLQQIERTLANWRALPPNPHRRAIFINIPRFRLYAVTGFEAHESQMLQINVVVGRTVENMRTPVFTEDMTHVIFRPYWDVPASIARNEIVPAARRDANYLARNHYELLDRSGRIVAATPEALDQLASGVLRVRQRPGADNALGSVKFMLPNSHNVYLHDTPSRALFSRSRRAFSHGCIRVEDPATLAQFVLQDDPTWTPERIAAAMSGDAPVRVDLAEPVRVYIVYGTAIAREDGSVLFLDDLYDLER